MPEGKANKGTMDIWVGKHSMRRNGERTIVLYFITFGSITKSEPDSLFTLKPAHLSRLLPAVSPTGGDGNWAECSTLWPSAQYFRSIIQPNYHLH
jgi:hypothetical protein